MIENHAEELRAVLLKNEDWLMDRVLQYAIEHGYAAYTSTLKEAWRLSISGLTVSIVIGAETLWHKLELSPNVNFAEDPVAVFGSLEARKHRARGVSFSMFLGLMKYYRQAYIDLIRKEYSEADQITDYELLINRIFDRIEIGFSIEWAETSCDEAIKELQVSNRDMTNEKNKYLTIFESIPTPIIILDSDNKIDNLNYSAASLISKNSVAGAHYYCLTGDGQQSYGYPNNSAMVAFNYSGSHGVDVSVLFPWLSADLKKFVNNGSESLMFEKGVATENEKFIFRAKISQNMDVSGKYKGIIIILEDITTLKNSLAETKTLRGLLPICAGCKSIRDDKGFWQRVEKYIEENSDAEFTHGLCPNCLEKYYPELYK